MNTFRLRPGRLILAAILLAIAAPLAAQQQPTQPPATPRERILERLRALDRPDTLRADTADTMRTRLPAGIGTPADTSVALGPATGPILERDSLVRALLALPGYAATEYQGDGARFTADSGLVELTGKSKIVREGQSMSADSLLRYAMDSEEICGYGKPIISGSEPSSAPVSSEQICYNLETRVGIARGARTTFTQTGTWYVTGQEVYPVGDDRLYAHDANFTDCDLQVPHYHFHAERVKMVRDNVMVARDVTLNFGDVPVFWLPFIAQSMKQGRRSGLLQPDFSVNDIARTNRGYNRRISNIGFYWAASEHTGLELAGEWFSNNYTSLAGTFEYRFLRQFLEGYLTTRRFWRENGSRELTLQSTNNWRPGERTTINLNGSYTTSSRFVQQNTFDPNELSRAIESTASFNHQFGWGSLSLGANRQQYLVEDRTMMRLPSFGLSLQPITFFSAPSTQAKWYNNMTWTGSVNGSSTTNDVADTDPSASVRDTRQVEARANSSFSIGNLQWSQDFSSNEDLRLAKDAVDTMPALGRESIRRTNWNTSLGYMQRLIGTSTFTPRISMTGSTATDPESPGRTVTSPVRMNVGAELRTDLFGFFPGIGAYSRIRHRLSPSINYTYAPALRADSIQKRVLSASNLEEQNRLSIGLNQTFEAKREIRDTAAAAADSIAAAQPGTPGEPRPAPRSDKITLLSLTTSAVAYDFVRARQDTIGAALPGLVETSISNQVSSDLLRGLTFQMTHELFSQPRDSLGAVAGGRKFSPRLSQLSTSFSIGSDSWIAKAIGLGRRESKEASQPLGAMPDSSSTPAAGFAQTPTSPDQTEMGMMGRGRDTRSLTPGGEAPGNVGSWNLNLNYMLQRPRESGSFSGSSNETQTIQASLTYQPTQKWGLSWRSNYSVTAGEFDTHWLTLTRDLHDWQAHFDFVKAQNGNFSFNFRVALKNQPDLKVEYEQRGQTDRAGQQIR